MHRSILQHWDDSKRYWERKCSNEHKNKPVFFSYFIFQFLIYCFCRKWLTTPVRKLSHGRIEKQGSLLMDPQKTLHKVDRAAVINPIMKDKVRSSESLSLCPLVSFSFRIWGPLLSHCCLVKPCAFQCPWCYCPSCFGGWTDERFTLLINEWVNDWWFSYVNWWVYKHLTSEACFTSNYWSMFYKYPVGHILQVTSGMCFTSN